MTAQILVIDDFEMFRSVAGDLLRPLGFEIVEASNGQEAVDLVRSGLRPVLILSDVQMPVMDGFAFLEAISEERCRSGIPIVLASGHPELEAKARAMGAASFIDKIEFDAKLVPLIQSLLAPRTFLQ